MKGNGKEKGRSRSKLTSHIARYFSTLGAIGTTPRAEAGLLVGVVVLHVVAEIAALVVGVYGAVVAEVGTQRAMVGGVTTGDVLASRSGLTAGDRACTWVFHLFFVSLQQPV